MSPAEVFRYVVNTWDTDCTLAQWRAEMELNEALSQVYAVGKWRGGPPVVWPDTPEIRAQIRQAVLIHEGRKAGREFMRRHRLRIAP